MLPCYGVSASTTTSSAPHFLQTQFSRERGGATALRLSGGRQYFISMSRLFRKEYQDEELYGIHIVVSSKYPE
jgi:hypothetical protein